VNTIVVRQAVPHNNSNLKANLITIVVRKAVLSYPTTINVRLPFQFLSPFLVYLFSPFLSLGPLYLRCYTSITANVDVTKKNLKIKL